VHSWAFRSLGDAGSAWDCSEKDVAFSIVFVHGFIGDHLQTWTHKRTEGLLRRTTAEVRLPDLLIQDPDPLPPCHIFSIAHEAGITSSTGLADAAGLIRAFIKSYVSGLEPIAFVAHSFGGLACRKAIIDLVDSNDEDESMLSERVLSLLMLATPNSGAEIARAAKALGSTAARDARRAESRLDRASCQRGRSGP
jgi:pimeloyl-ACP methyl ester carboxylesterase